MKNEEYSSVDAVAILSIGFEYPIEHIRGSFITKKKKARRDLKNVRTKNLTHLFGHYGQIQYNSEEELLVLFSNVWN